MHQILTRIAIAEMKASLLVFMQLNESTLITQVGL